MIRFSVPGIPSYSNVFNDSNREQLQEHIAKQLPTGFTPYNGEPLHLIVTFLLPLPPQYNTKKPSYRCNNYATGAPELQELIERIKFLCADLVFQTTHSISCVTAQKSYHESPRTLVRITKAPKIHIMYEEDLRNV